MTEENEFLCELCYPDGIEIGELVPGYCLILNDKKYSVLSPEAQGHKDGILFTFQLVPKKSPFPLDDNSDRDYNKGDYLKDLEWVKEVQATNEELFTAYGGYLFTSACIKSGWDVKQCSSLWFWVRDRCAKLIETNEIKK